MIKCIICDSDNWTNVDEYRIKKSGMCVCDNCGFITYPEIVKADAKLKDYYREEYRKPPTFGNLCTGQRKLYYHEYFLRDTFAAWKESGKKPVCTEIGAAFGMALNMIRHKFPDGDFSGTELTKSFRRVAWHVYQLNLSEEFDASKKYDLISSYKVAEHQPFIDKYLRQYVESLADDGLMYISVPTWFGPMTNFGAAGFDLEYYYHTNHINVWTKNHFEVLLDKVGLEIIKHDDKMYDDTYLCKRNDSLMQKKYDWPMIAKQDTIKKLEAIKKSSEAMTDGNYEAAIAAWPNFPTAWICQYEVTRKQQDELGFDKIIAGFIANAKVACEHSVDILMLEADVCMRYNQWDNALGVFKSVLSQKPAHPVAVINTGHCLRNMVNASTDADVKTKLLEESSKTMEYLKEISLQSVNEATNWLYQDSANLPTPHEEKEK